MTNNAEKVPFLSKEYSENALPWLDWECFENSFVTGLAKAKQMYADWDGCIARLRECGSIGIFPCNGFANDLLERLAIASPEQYAKIKAAFDPFPERATFRKDIAVRSCQDLQEIELDLLLVAANNFPGLTALRLREDLIRDVPIISFARLTDEFSNVNSDQLLRDILATWNLLADQESKETYLRVWLARAWCSEEFLKVFSELDIGQGVQRDIVAGTVRFAGYELEGVNDGDTLAELAQEVYRIPGVSPQEGDIVVDAGAFRGDTVAFFEKYIGKNGKIYALEPDPVNMSFLKKNRDRNGWENVYIFPYGLSESSRQGQLLASESGGAFLRVLDSDKIMQQSNPIQLRELDGFVQEQDIPRIDFLKADIEGSEMAMLRGAKQSLRTFRPKIALAAYHKMQDLIELPRFVHDLEGYRLYMRHYSAGAWGTVLYGVPEEKIVEA